MLGMLGVGDPQHVAGELDDHMLEATAGAQQGHVLGPGVGDGVQRALHTPVEATGAIHSARR